MLHVSLMTLLVILLVGIICGMIIGISLSRPRF